MITKGYDIDGVISVGVFPERDAILITGRSCEEAPETYQMLRRRGIFNAVYFNPKCLYDTTLENSAEWKAKIITESGITDFYEDSTYQAQIIKTLAPKVNLILV